MDDQAEPQRHLCHFRRTRARPSDNAVSTYGNLAGADIFEVTLQDPNNRYLPRRANVHAPAQVEELVLAPETVETTPASQ